MPHRTAVSPACFAALSRYEISSAGSKLVGSAQKRLRQALLQHGAIPLRLDRQRLFACLQVPAAQRQQLVQQASRTMAAVNEVAPAPVTHPMLHEALRRAFAETFCAELHESVPSAEEWRLAQHLLLSKYATPTWNLGGGAVWRQTQPIQELTASVHSHDASARLFV
jgi:lipoate-protein ligase A